MKTRLSVEGPIDCPLTGQDLLNNPSLNKGTAFSFKEREEFDIVGLLPVHENTLGTSVAHPPREFWLCWSWFLIILFLHDIF